MLTWLLLAALTLPPHEPLPVLKGEYLSGRKAELPQDAKGKVAVLLFGFSYDSRFQVEPFGKRLAKDMANRTDVAWYEIPMIGGLSMLGRPFIDSGMRKGTPRPQHENVITVYGGIGPWKKALRVDNDKQVYAVVLDQAGKPRWQYSGPFTEAAYADLLQVIAAAALPSR